MLNGAIGIVLASPHIIVHLVLKYWLQIPVDSSIHGIQFFYIHFYDLLSFSRDDTSIIMWD